MVKIQRRRAAALSDRVYDAILDQIRTGVLFPGQQLPSEDRLAQRFGVTRTTLRRGLKRLRDDRLVAAVKGAGNFVVRAPPATLPEWHRSAAPSDLHNGIELRRALEVEAAGLAAERRQECHIAAMHAAVQKMETALSASSGGATFVSMRLADLAFHTAVLEAAGNPSLRTLAEPFVMHPDNWLHVAVGASPLHRLVESVAREHRAILTAIETAHAEASRATMRLHVSNGLARHLAA